MKTNHTIITPRLVLRPFADCDRVSFADMNADPKVMRFFAGTFSAEKSADHSERYGRQLERDGFSFLTVELRATGDYLGILGMQVMTFAVPNLPQPAVEIGWRLRQSAHGYGYATEGAQAIVDHAFLALGLPTLVAITATGNQASRRVMEKLGMKYLPELTFNHPMVPADHPHREHVLYRLPNPHPSEEAPCSTHL